MDAFSTELVIRLSFVKTSEFRGDGFEPPKPLSVRHCHKPFESNDICNYIEQV
jgi:hypothetical protein